jgi:hypothetical protein
LAACMVKHCTYRSIIVRISIFYLHVCVLMLLCSLPGGSTAALHWASGSLRTHAGLSCREVSRQKRLKIPYYHGYRTIIDLLF